MAEKSITVELAVMPLCRPDGLIVAVRLHAPKFADQWFWLNRDNGSLEDLREYHLGMLPEGRSWVIELPRETVAQLVAAGHGVLPYLIAHRLDAAAWALSEALHAAETALLDDDRAEDVVDSP